MDIKRIKAAIERSVSALSARPGAAKVAEKTVVTGTGDQFEVKEGPWTFRVDAHESFGGLGVHPGPNTLGRAALGYCMMHSIIATFALKEIPIRWIEVEVESHADVRGAFGIDPNEPSGFKELKYRVKVDSDATPEQLDQIVAAAEKMSPWYDNMSKPFSIKREIVPAD